MSDIISSLLIQIKADATSAIQSLKTVATGTTQLQQAVVQADSAFGAVAQSQVAFTVAAQKMGQSAQAAGGHIAGMSYYFRSFFDSMRFAMLGNPMAAFYMVDEATRAMVASGLSLVTIGGIIGGLGAAVGGTYVIWKELGNHIDEDVEKAKKLADTLEKIPGIVKRAHEAEKLGAISPEERQKVEDILSNKTPLFVGPGSDLRPKGKGNPDDPENIRYMNLVPGPFAAGLGTKPFVGPVSLLELLSTTAIQSGPLGPMNPVIPPPGPEATQDNRNDAARQIIDKGMAAHQKTVAQNEVSQADIAEQNKANKPSEEEMRQQLESMRAIKEQDAQDFAETNKQIEDKITDKALQSGKTRESFYKEEATMRIEAAQRALYSGQISEEKYADAVRVAQQEIIAGDQKRREELQRQAQLSREIQRDAIENQIDSAKTNDFLTAQQKLQIVSALEAKQQQINNAEISELEKLKSQVKSLSDQLELEKRIADLKHENQKISDDRSPDEQSSFAFQWTAMLTAQSSKWTGWAQESANAFANAWNGATNGVSAGLTHLFEYGAQRGQWFREIWNGVVGSMISSVTKLGVEWVSHLGLILIRHIATEEGMTAATAAGSIERGGIRIVETVMHNTMVALRLAAHVAGEVAATAATAVQTMARAIYHAIAAAVGAMESESSVPYVGVILGIAAGAAIMAAAYGLMGGFKVGGYTGDGHPDQVMGVVHAGEYVTPANRTSSARNLLAAIHRGDLTDVSAPRMGAFVPPMAKAGSQASGATHIQTSHYIYTDKGKMARAIEMDDAHAKWVVDTVAKSSYKA